MFKQGFLDDVYKERPVKPVVTRFPPEPNGKHSLYNGDPRVILGLAYHPVTNKDLSRPAADQSSPQASSILVIPRRACIQVPEYPFDVLIQSTVGLR